MRVGRLALAATCALLVAVAGCGQDGAGSADLATELYSEGVSDLYHELSGADLDGAPWEWGIDTDDAMSKFDEALQHDPDHCGALLGSALTHVMSVLADPELGEILGEIFPEERDDRARAILWYARVPRLDALARAAGRRGGDFAFSGLQDYVEETALPEFALADQRLTRFENLGCQVDVLVVIPDSLSRRGVDGRADRDQVLVLELDVTDALFAHAGLDALQAVCHALCAYELDTEQGETLEYLIEEDEDFLTLREGDHTGAVYDEITSLAQHLTEAAAALDGEVDGQGNDLITETGGVIELDELLDGSSVGIVSQLGMDIESALTEGVAVDLSDLDPEAPQISVLVDLDELLNHPLADLREYLPAHTWPTADSMSVTHPVAMPDPTLDGITPELTQQDWDAIVTWLEGA